MEETLLQAIHADPADATTWLVLADWLEENGQPERAEFLRLRELLREQPDVERRAEREDRLQKLLLGGVEPVVAKWTVELADDVALTFALVPAGSFLMGSPEDEKDRYQNESPRHRVTISQPFYLGVFPVTQRQWEALMDSNPSTFTEGTRPVESVAWPECQEFCQRLSERVGRTCRLPYEAEWEYACRGGTTSSFYTGEGLAAMKRAGWCSYRGSSGSARRTRPVGQYLPNPFGLYDLHGNVREWCQDDLRRYTRRPQVDPHGPLSGTYRVVRGGSWYYGAEDSRAACRYNRPIDYHLDYYGFRVLMPCPPASQPSSEPT
ncbi:MAG: SUMF1/EgtB/PvdO family nonheme iron enzyme [Gemmataceae bacterium]